VKSETAEKKGLSVKIDGARLRVSRGVIGVKNGVKSGSFWQSLSQDEAALFYKLFSLIGHVYTLITAAI
jgi:hypothetical protein